MAQIRFIYKYFIHFFTARHTNGFGVHSPFVYQFVTSLLSEKHYFYKFSEIEAVRESLKVDKRQIDITDFGTGNDRVESVQSVLKKVVKNKKQGQLLYRIINYFKLRNVLELGTSLGVTTAYLASSTKDVKCVTLEGCPQIAQIATENFQKLGLSNIELVVGNIDSTLEVVLESIQSLDFVFIDANHRSEALLRYFDQCVPKMHKNSILVLDDIYLTEDMENAWKIIKANQNVIATIDLFHLGVVFFNTDLHKKHYKVRYF